MLLYIKLCKQFKPQFVLQFIKLLTDKQKYSAFQLNLKNSTISEIYYNLLDCGYALSFNEPISDEQFLPSIHEWFTRVHYHPPEFYALFTNNVKNFVNHLLPVDESIILHELHNQLDSPGSSATNYVNSKADYFKFVRPVPAVERKPYRLFVSQKLEQVKVRHFVNCDIDQHVHWCYLYAYLKKAIPQQVLGFKPNQYSLLALDHSLAHKYFFRSDHFRNTQLPLDYSGFDESITQRMILILL